MSAISILVTKRWSPGNPYEYFKEYSNHCHNERPPAPRFDRGAS